MEGNTFLRAAVIACLQVRVVLRVPVLSLLRDAIVKVHPWCERVKPLPPLRISRIIRFYAPCYLQAVGHIHILPEPSLMRVALTLVQGRPHDLQSFPVQKITCSSTIENDLVRCNVAELKIWMRSNDTLECNQVKHTCESVHN